MPLKSRSSVGGPCRPSNLCLCTNSGWKVSRFAFTVHAVELGIMAVKEVCTRSGIDPVEGVVDQLYMGQVLQAGCGQAPARQVAIGAGLPVTTCTTINKVCGSSLKAAMIAATEIRAGVSEVVIVGGWSQ